MNMFRFEIRKIWKQKKILLLLLIVFLVIGGVFLQYNSQQSKMGERALEKIIPIIEESDIIYKELKLIEREFELGEMESLQLTYVNEMAKALFQWKSAIYNKLWGEIPDIENDFLTGLQLYAGAGGTFDSLSGIEREKAIEKNAWLRIHQLQYEDEKYPISPALLLKSSADILLGVGGVLLIVLLFGNTITVEKEQQTWLTLKTQPIAKWRQIVAKYASQLFIMIAFIIMVLGIGLLIPIVFGDHVLTINYPQIVSTGDTFAIISTAGYLTRAIILFACAALFIFSLIMFLSTRMKNSFSMLILTGFITLVGYVVTHVNASLQTFWNPFQLFRMSQVASELPKSTDWLYLLSTLSWASLLLVLAILLPEGERGLFQASEQRKPFHSGKTRRLNSVWNSSLFEWRKMKRRGHLKQLYIVFGLLVIVGYFVVAQQAHEKESDYIEGLKSHAANLEDKYIPGVQHQIDSIDKELEMAEESGNEAMATYYRDGSALANLENISTILNEEFFYIKNAMDGFEKGNWIPFYAYQLHQNEFHLESATQLKKWVMLLRRVIYRWRLSSMRKIG